MKFKVVEKTLILTDYSHKITEGENSFDTVEIAVPKKHDDCDISTLSFRFSETSEDGEKSAVQILRHTKCDGKYIYLKGTITSDFSAITGKVIFMLTGINGENVVAKFQSAPFTVNDDISLASLPNETTAEQLFNQAQLEVQKAIDAAERAEIASQTPAPAEIYPATSERLGGVKVDDKTIISSEDGTISALDSENLKNEIADVKLSQEFVSNLAVQIAHHNNYLIYDDLGKPSVMVAIPKFYLDDVIDDASHTVHPAFIINGIERDVIYISKYQNIVENGRAYSLPMKKPQTNVTFDQAYNYCKEKGKGWHLMTNAEWAAIALWCKKNGTMPKGNNNYGKDISESNLPQKAIAATRGSDGQINKTLTGSGGVTWNHDNTEAGISDLNGNIWEIVSGLRQDHGEIQIIADNDAADFNNSIVENSQLWKAILPDGTLADLNTEGSIHYTITQSLSSFTDVSVTPSVKKDGLEFLESIGILPHENSNLQDYGNDNIYFNIYAKTIAMRGSRWTMGNGAGVFSLDLANTRSSSSDNIGFRSAYYEA